ncbi:hypothetical protein TB2_013192 [Malus domestica]
MDAKSVYSSSSSGFRTPPPYSHTHISFAASTKASTQSQGLRPASSNQSSSPPVMVSSPTTTTSSMAKSAGGSPRITSSTSIGNKDGQVSSLLSQQAKNSPTVPSQKSSPVGGRNVPSILGPLHHNNGFWANNGFDIAVRLLEPIKQRVSSSLPPATARTMPKSPWLLPERARHHLLQPFNLYRRPQRRWQNHPLPQHPLHLLRPIGALTPQNPRK